MAGEEVGGGEAAAAFALQGLDAQSAVAASDDDSSVVGLQNHAGRPGESHDVGLPDFEEAGTRRQGCRRFQLILQMGESSWPGHEAADAIPNHRRRLVPINLAVRFFNLW